MKILNKIPENNMISPNFIQEENLENYIGFSKEDIVLLLGESETCNNDELVYTIQSKFFGLYKQKLYLYFFNEKLRDYYIGV